MRPMLAMFAVTATLGASGCNRSAEAGAAGEAAVDAPVRAAGQWREFHTIDGVQAPRVNHCVAAKDIVETHRLAPRPGEECREFETGRKGGTFTVSLVCKRGATTVTKKTRASGNFASSFSIETVTTMDPVPDSFGAKAVSTYRITAERTGDC